MQLMKIMVKVSDISNEVRPMAVAEPWLDCLLQEFFNQVSKNNLAQNWDGTVGLVVFQKLRTRRKHWAESGRRFH